MNSRQAKVEDIEETEEAIVQRYQLRRIREFLLANDAAPELIDAIDIALEDIERWISPAIEIAMGTSTPQSRKS